MGRCDRYSPHSAVRWPAFAAVFFAVLTLIATAALLLVVCAAGAAATIIAATGPYATEESGHFARRKPALRKRPSPPSPPVTFGPISTLAAS